MTLLVTGGAGFVGSHFVVDWLGAHDEPIVNLDALTYAGDLRNLGRVEADLRHRFVHGDIGDGALVAGLLARHRPRAVLHFAAESHVDRSIAAPDAFLRTNVLGSFVLLDAVKAYWSALEAEPRAAFRFLHVSTDEVYGSLADGGAPFTEESRYAPNSPYAASKAASDHLVRAWHTTYGLPVLATQCSNNYGPRHLCEKLIPRAIVAALAAEPLPLYGDGLHVRDWLHVGDHVRALVAVLERGRVGDTYNIGGRSPLTNRVVVETVCDLLDELKPRARGSYREQIACVADRPGHDRRYEVDPGKIERELGWRPRVSFAEGLRETVRWYLAHPEWVEAMRRKAAG